MLEFFWTKGKGYGQETIHSQKIINILREAEVLLNQDSTVGEVCRKFGISLKTYYRWRKGHEWGYDFAMIRTTNGRSICILVILDD